MADPEPTFLARENYRRRRLGDAAKLVPVLGLVLMLVPILWSGSYGTSGAMIYVFVVWGALILLIGGLSRLLAKAGAKASAIDGAPASER